MFFDGSFGYNSIDHRTQQQLHTQFYTINHYKQTTAAQSIELLATFYFRLCLLLRRKNIIRFLRVSQWQCRLGLTSWMDFWLCVAESWNGKIKSCIERADGVFVCVCVRVWLGRACACVLACSACVICLWCGYACIRWVRVYVRECWIHCVLCVLLAAYCCCRSNGHLVTNRWISHLQIQLSTDYLPFHIIRE